MNIVSFIIIFGTLLFPIGVVLCFPGRGVTISTRNLGPDLTTFRSPSVGSNSTHSIVDMTKQRRIQELLIGGDNPSYPPGLFPVGKRPLKHSYRAWESTVSSQADPEQSPFAERFLKCISSQKIAPGYNNLPNIVQYNFFSKST